MPLTVVESGPPKGTGGGGDRPGQMMGHVKQVAFWTAISTLGWVFWACGGMEMVERLAFYGVRAVAGLYATDAISKGGLGLKESALGTIFMTWALVQSLVPIFTGGISDRIGYKETIVVSTFIKIFGYLIMAWSPTYGGFFTGAVVLALGTAVFKPGIQGTIVKATKPENSSIAWGIFYQTVNIGGFLGPLLAGFMRKMEWAYVFYSCAAIISLNFLLVLTYKEPGKEERLERRRKVAQGVVKEKSLFADSVSELKKTHVWTYLLVFAGFWFMFNAFFDVLPLHIRDWVNTHDIVATLFGKHGPTSEVVRFFIVMNPEGTEILPEGLLNLNAFLIMLTCFFFAWLSGKFYPTSSIVFGTILATASLVALGYSSFGWAVIFSIGIFSVGEMFSSPKFNEFIGNFAPSDKKAMYLGFSQLPLAIGWTLEGKFGPMLYEHYASKDDFSREMLIERGMAADLVEQIPQGEAFNALVQYTHQSAQELTSILHASHNIGMVWFIMAAVGAVTIIGIYVYGRWVQTLRST